MIQLLLHFDVRVVDEGTDGGLTWWLLAGHGKRALVIDKLYRGDYLTFINPSEKLLKQVREDAWDVWNNPKVWR